MKKTLFAFTLALSVVLSACGTEGNEDTPTVNTGSEDRQMEEKTVEENESVEETEDEVEEQQGTRTNPYELGDTAEIIVSNSDGEGKAKIKIDNVLRGDEALERMNELSYGNHEAPGDDNSEWTIFDVTFALTEFVDDNTEYKVVNNFSIFDGDGKKLSTNTAYIDSVDSNELYQGATVEMSEAYQVPKDGEFLIRVTEGEEDIFYRVD